MGFSPALGNEQRARRASTMSVLPPEGPPPKMASTIMHDETGPAASGCDRTLHESGENVVQPQTGTNVMAGVSAQPETKNEGPPVPQFATASPPACISARAPNMYDTKPLCQRRHTSSLQPMSTASPKSSPQFGRKIAQNRHMSAAGNLSPSAPVKGKDPRQSASGTSTHNRRGTISRNRGASTVSKVGGQSEFKVHLPDIGRARVLVVLYKVVPGQPELGKLEFYERKNCGKGMPIADGTRQEYRQNLCRVQQEESTVSPN